MDGLDQSREGSSTGEVTNAPSRPAVVIFQLGEGSSDNYLIDLPALTVTNSNFTRLHPQRGPQQGTPDVPSHTSTTPASIPASSTTASASSATIASTSASASASASVSTSASSTTSAPSSTHTTSTSQSAESPAQTISGQQASQEGPSSQRNMSVSVSYVYSHTPSDNGQETRREGTIMLNVPNVPFNRTEGQMNNMIELAASIALGAVAAFTQRRHPEISKASFDRFSLVDKLTLADDTCPICYDAYLPLPSLIKQELKGENILEDVTNIKQKNVSLNVGGEQNESIEEGVNVKDDDASHVSQVKNEYGKRSREDDNDGVEEGVSTSRKSQRLVTEQTGTSSSAAGIDSPSARLFQLHDSVDETNPRTNSRHSASSSPAISPFDTLHHNELREQLRASTRDNETATQEPEAVSNLDNDCYTHIPVELPCGHVFGRNCSYQWLKTKSTCPLCRMEVHSDVSDQNPPQTINLPDIASFMTATSNRRRPLVIVLDRNTNTLSTRVGQQDPSDFSRGSVLGLAPPGSSSFNDTSSSATGSMVDDEAAFENILPLTGFPNDSLDPVGIPLRASAYVSPTRVQRDPSSLETLNESSSPRRTDGLFPIGVASRRTRQGVQTLNLDNESSTMGFATEARRMLLERRLLLHGRDRFLGFNERGEAITLPYSRGASNGLITSSSSTEELARQMDETTQTDGTTEQNDGD